MSYGAAERIDIDEFERRLRGPAPRASGDPLAELARLVTPATSKPEALDAIFGHSRPKNASSRAAHDDAHSFGHDEPRGRVADDQSFPPDTFDHVYDRPGAPGAHYTAEPEAAEEWAYAPADERPATESAPRSKRPLYATAAVIAFGLLGIGATFAFRGHTASDGSLVEVKAPSGPTKVQVQAAAADSNSASANSTILDRGANPTPVTRVIDRQEQPVDLKEVARSPRAVSLSPTGSSQLAGASGDAGSVFAEPRRVKTVSVRPDGTIVGSANEASAAPARSEQVPASQPPGAARSATPKSATRVATTPKPPAEKPEVAVRTPAAKPAKPARTQVAEGTETQAPETASGKSFSVQLAAPANEAEARAAATRFGQKFSGQLQGARITWQKASDKSVYRVRAAGMSRETAVATCERIKAAGGACFVAQN